MNYRFIRVTDGLNTLIPWPKWHREFRIFINHRPGLGGPGNFVARLERQLQKQKILLTYNRLYGSKGALLISNSWGDWFHQLCKQWNIRTVLRVNGFYLPTYFDNRPQPPEFQDRQLTLKKMAINYRMQRDIMLSDFVIYQSAFSKQMADHFLYNRREHFSIVYNGVNLDEFCPGPIRQGKRRLLLAGTLRDEYMLGTALPVFKKLWQHYDLELLIVGSKDEVSCRLLEEFFKKDPQASERIQIIDKVPNEDMPNYIQQADILLHPRLGDWCPNVVIEALACGLAVVCGSWGGTAELVGDAGVAVPTGPWEYGEQFVKGLSDGVIQILNDLDHYKAVARTRAETKFDIRSIGSYYLNALGIRSS